jgi:hypothetical protein
VGEQRCDYSIIPQQRMPHLAVHASMITLQNNPGSCPVLVMTGAGPRRAIGASSKRFCMRELAQSVIARKPWHIRLNQSMSRRWSGREEEASGQQVEAGPAEHLALQHLQAVDVPFDRSLTPR